MSLRLTVRQVMIDDIAGNQYRMVMDFGSRRTLRGNPVLLAPQKQGLDAHRAAAIEAIVRDGEGMPPKALPMVRLQARRAVIEWHEDKEAATEIEARLDRNEFDAIDINAEVFVQALELFLMFDQLMHSAQAYRGVARDQHPT